MNKRPSLEAMLCPRSIAVVGASPRAGTAGSNIIANLQECGFPRAIYPVNPRYPKIHGLKAYPSLAEIGCELDAVFIAVAADHGPEIMRQAVAAGARSVLLNATGYSDGGAEGMRRQAEIVALANEAGIPVCGPNNLGLVNVADAIPLWTAGHLPSMKKGPVAVISQSGSVALALGDDTADLGLSYVITTGNEAVSGVGDYVDVLADDERVQTILLFLETIRDPARLAAAALRARSAGKKIFAMKVGRSEMARAAVSAHSGALSGEDEVCNAFFRKYGIVRASDLDDLVQFASLSLLPRPTEGCKAAYITLSGGQAAAIADCAADAGIEVSDFSPHVAQSLSQYFGGQPAHNPMDAWGLGWDPARFAEMMDILLEAKDVDPIIFTLDIPASGHVDGPMGIDMALIAGQRKQSGKHVLFVANSAISGANPEIIRLCREHGFPVLLGIGGALRAVATWTKAAAPGAAEIAAVDAKLDRETLRQLLAEKVRFVGSRPAETGAQAIALAEAHGYPVVLKGIAPNAMHKTELGLVKLGISSSTEVASAYEELRAILDANVATLGKGTVEVQPMIEPGIELLVAARRDPLFGPVTVVGTGGKLVELIKDSAIRLGRVSSDEAGAMIGETRLATLLGGYRDGIVYDLDAAKAAIAVVSDLMTKAGPDVTAIEINPLIVLPKGKAAVAVDLLLE